MISAAHMIGGMLRYEKFLKNCLGEYFDQILYNFFFKVISLYRTMLLRESYSYKYRIWHMLMGFQGISPMNKHEV